MKNPDWRFVFWLWCPGACAFSLFASKFSWSKDNCSIALGFLRGWESTRDHMSLTMQRCNANYICKGLCYWSLFSEELFSLFALWAVVYGNSFHYSSLLVLSSLPSCHCMTYFLICRMKKKTSWRSCFTFSLHGIAKDFFSSSKTMWNLALKYYKTNALNLSSHLKAYVCFVWETYQI